jgi:dethiobiotin synthetase
MDLGLPLIIIARPGLGTINHSLLTVEAARKKGIEVLGLIFNYAEKTKNDISQKTNPGIVSKLGDVPVLGIVPHMLRSDKAKSHRLFYGVTAKLM